MKWKKDIDDRFRPITPIESPDDCLYLIGNIKNTYRPRSRIDFISCANNDWRVDHA